MSAGRAWGTALNFGTTVRAIPFVVPGSKWYCSHSRQHPVTVTEVIGVRVLFVTWKGERRELEMYGFTQCYRRAE